MVHLPPDANFSLTLLSAMWYKLPESGLLVFVYLTCEIIDPPRVNL